MSTEYIKSEMETCYPAKQADDAWVSEAEKREGYRQSKRPPAVALWLKVWAGLCLVCVALMVWWVVR